MDKIDFNVYGQDSLDTITQLNFQLYLRSNNSLDSVYAAMVIEVLCS